MKKLKLIFFLSQITLFLNAGVYENLNASEKMMVDTLALVQPEQRKSLSPATPTSSLNVSSTSSRHSSHISSRRSSTYSDSNSGYDADNEASSRLSLNDSGSNSDSASRRSSTGSDFSTGSSSRRFSITSDSGSNSSGYLSYEPGSFTEIESDIKKRADVKDSETSKRLDIKMDEAKAYRKIKRLISGPLSEPSEPSDKMGPSDAGINLNHGKEEKNTIFPETLPPHKPLSPNKKTADRAQEVAKLSVPINQKNHSPFETAELLSRANIEQQQQAAYAEIMKNKTLGKAALANISRTNPDSSSRRSSTSLNPVTTTPPRNIASSTSTTSSTASNSNSGSSTSSDPASFKSVNSNSDLAFKSLRSHSLGSSYNSKEFHSVNSRTSNPNSGSSSSNSGSNKGPNSPLNKYNSETRALSLSSTKSSSSNPQEYPQNKYPSKSTHSNSSSSFFEPAKINSSIKSSSQGTNEYPSPTSSLPAVSVRDWMDNISNSSNSNDIRIDIDNENISPENLRPRSSSLRVNSPNKSNVLQNSLFNSDNQSITSLNESNLALSPQGEITDPYDQGKPTVSLPFTTKHYSDFNLGSTDFNPPSSTSTNSDSSKSSNSSLNKYNAETRALSLSSAESSSSNSQKYPQNKYTSKSTHSNSSSSFFKPAKINSSIKSSSQGTQEYSSPTSSNSSRINIEDWIDNTFNSSNSNKIRIDNENINPENLSPRSSSLSVNSPNESNVLQNSLFDSDNQSITSLNESNLALSPQGEITDPNVSNYSDSSDYDGTSSNASSQALSFSSKTISSYSLRPTSTNSISSKDSSSSNNSVRISSATSTPRSSISTASNLSQEDPPNRLLLLNREQNHMPSTSSNPSTLEQLNGLADKYAKIRTVFNLEKLAEVVDKINNKAITKVDDAIIDAIIEIKNTINLTEQPKEKISEKHSSETRESMSNLINALNKIPTKESRLALNTAIDSFYKPVNENFHYAILMLFWLEKQNIIKEENLKNILYSWKKEQVEISSGFFSLNKKTKSLDLETDLMKNLNSFLGDGAKRIELT